MNVVELLIYAAAVQFFAVSPWGSVGEKTCFAAAHVILTGERLS